jgi:hypothetical protein
LFRVRPLQDSSDIFHIRVRPYHGKHIQLNDGETIRQGDRIVELHFDNRKLYEIGMRSKTAMKTAIQLIRAVERVMPKLAELILTRPEYAGVKGIYGVSLINRGPEQLGFSVIDLPRGLFSHITRLYLRLLLLIIHPKGTKRLKERTEMLVPKIIAMSTKELAKRYYRDFRSLSGTMKQDTSRKDAMTLQMPTSLHEQG